MKAAVPQEAGSTPLKLAGGSYADRCPVPPVSFITDKPIVAIKNSR